MDVGMSGDEEGPFVNTGNRSLPGFSIRNSGADTWDTPQDLGAPPRAIGKMS